MTDTFSIVFIICNLFSTYLLSRFMGVFFYRETANKSIEVCSYAAYFFINTSMFFFGKPLVVLISSVLCYFIISFNYEASLVKRVVSVCLICLIIFLIETLVLNLTGYFYTKPMDDIVFSSSIILIIVQIVSVFFVQILEKLHNIKANVELSGKYWLLIFFVPFLSIIIGIILLQSEGIGHFNIIVCMLFLLMINFAIYYLYNEIILAFINKIENIVLIEQNKAYNNQMKLLVETTLAEKTLRHDFKNHLTVMQAYEKNGDYSQLRDYIGTMIESIHQEAFAYSGNSVVDCILNYKLSLAKSCGIDCNLNLNIPTELTISPFDISVLLGNTLDNAISAVQKLKNDKYINISIKFTKGCLLIKAENKFNGTLINRNGILETTKSDKKNHGLGIKSIKRISKKYNGTVDIVTNKDIFSIAILIHLT